MRFKKIITIFIWLCLGFSIISLFVFINLPHIMESQIEKHLPDFLNPAEIDFDIDKIGFFNTVISRIHVNRGILIDSVHVDYTINRVPDIHIKKIILSGLSIHAELDSDNHIKIMGLNFPDTKKNKDRSSVGSFLPFLPEKVVMKNARLILHAKGSNFFIPFNVMSTLYSKNGEIKAKASLYPFGEKIDIMVTYDINTGIKSLEVDGRSFNLGSLDTLISKIAPRVQLKGLMNFHLNTMSFQKKWDIKVSGISLVRPVRASIKKISSIVLINKKAIKFNGRFVVTNSLIPETNMGYTLTIDRENFIKKRALFGLSIKNINTHDYKITRGADILKIKNPQFNARLSGSLLKNKGKITLDIAKADLVRKKETLLFKDSRISSDITMDFTGKGNGLSSKWAVTAKHIRIRSGDMKASFPGAIVSGRAFFDKIHQPSIQMVVKAAGGTLAASKFKMLTTGIRFDIPISYPGPKQKSYGTYAVAGISYNNQYQFSSKGKILQKGLKKFQIKGEMIFNPLPDIKTMFKSDIDMENGILASLNFKINPVKLNNADIEKITGQFSQPADIELTAGVKGKATYINHSVKSSMRLTIRDGKVFLPDADFTASGIHTRIDFNDLMVPESVPGQVAGIDLIKIKDIKINDAKIRFSIEDAKTLLVENIKFKWCNGLVSSESIRFPQADNIYSLILYCDRLELTQLLKQMGAFHAEGSGTLNGRIPVLYSDGNIEFDNGFLFSTPGSGGKIVVENTDRITAGIPMDSPQFAQLDLAREALKDFDYKWAKLVFHTFDDTLFVNMELDGKPSKLLPFEYKKEIGGFIRVNAASPGSHFQGIKLDVNLKLPFNEVMKFGNKIKSIFN